MGPEVSRSLGPGAETQAHHGMWNCYTDDEATGGLWLVLGLKGPVESGAPCWSELRELGYRGQTRKAAE